MQLQALLVTRDPTLRREMHHALDENFIEVEVCSEGDDARKVLARNKFDILVLDWDNKYGAQEILPEVRRGSLNRRCVIFAITSGISTVKATYEMGADFVLDKPISAEHASRYVQAAVERILQERRRYLRHPTQTAGNLSFGNLMDLRVQVCNVSEGGASVQSSLPLYQGWGVELKLDLPGSEKPIEIAGYVAWANKSGMAGVKFMVWSVEARKELDRWLSEQVAAQMLNEISSAALAAREISRKADSGAGKRDALKKRAAVNHLPR